MRYFILLCMLFLFNCENKEGKVINVDFFYIPFGVETYIPVTISNIEKQGKKKNHYPLKENNFKSMLLLLKNAKHGHFDDQYIRLKIISPKREIVYIDNNGGFRFNSEDKKLDSKTFLKLKKIIESIYEE